MYTIQELEKQGKYVYRHKKVIFEGGLTDPTPQRKDEYPDSFDTIFNSKSDFDSWYKSMVSGLAELDGAMNYCKFFQRDKGNAGRYVRGCKECLVNGQWTRYYIEAQGSLPKTGWYEGLKEFQNFLKDNKWEDSWFELMERYK